MSGELKYSEREEARIGKAIAKSLSIKKLRDRKSLDGGPLYNLGYPFLTKTNRGLFKVILRLAHDIESGDIYQTLELPESKLIAELTAFEITYSDGSVSRTNMAAGVTLEEAQEYFIGKRFDVGMYGIKENMQEAVKVTRLY